MLGLKAQIKHFFTLFLPENYWVCKGGGAGSTCHVSSDVLPTLAPHQPCHQQSPPRGVKTMWSALQWGRRRTWEPTHSITVDSSSGKVILLTTGHFAMGKADLLFRGDGDCRDVFLPWLTAGFLPVWSRWSEILGGIGSWAGESHQSKCRLNLECSKVTSPQLQGE